MPRPVVTAPLGQYNWLARDFIRDGGNIPDFDVFVAGHGEQYNLALRQAFTFFRRHADGRYSSRTLMRLANAQDRLDGGLTEGLPMLAVAQVPARYDEMTEEKHGGIVGMAILWTGMDGRVILAVKRDERRRKVGTALLQLVRNEWGSCHLWVGRYNQPGQHFLVSCGLFPTQLGTSGAIRYALNEDIDEEGLDEATNDHVAPLAYRVMEPNYDTLTWDPLPVSEQETGW